MSLLLIFIKILHFDIVDNQQAHFQIQEIHITNYTKAYYANDIFIIRYTKGVKIILNWVIIQRCFI